MKKPNHFYVIIISILTFSILISCGSIPKSMADKHLTVESGAIPPEFGKNNSTILFITKHRSYNKYLKKNVKKIYKGKYEFIPIEELSNSKYQDLNEYKYFFSYNQTSGGDFANYTVKQFKVVDRIEKKEYISKLTSSYWSKIQQVYLEKLNEKLQKELN